MSAEAIDSKISNLKRGKAEVIESNHVLILGWSSKIVKLLQELCLAERYQVTELLAAMQPGYGSGACSETLCPMLLGVASYTRIEVPQGLTMAPAIQHRMAAALGARCCTGQ